MTIRVHCNLCGFVPGKTGGAEVFLAGLLPEVEALSGIELTLYGSQATLKWATGLLKKEPLFETVSDSSTSLKSRLVAMRRLKSYCKPGDIIWSPLNQGVGQFNGVKEVMTIHDLIPLHYAQNRTTYPRNLKRRFAFWVRWTSSMRAARRSSAVMTVSNACVEPMKNALGKNGPPVYPAPNGLDPIKRVIADARRWQYTGDKKVIAVTSGTYPHKGLKTLELVARRMPEIEFKIIGKRSPQISLSNVKFTGRISDVELAEEYLKTSALFYPSRIEGFGLPVVEALYFGTPVVATDIPVLREVGGPETRYFEMDNIDEAVNLLRTTIESQETSEAMSRIGIEHAAQFTWQAAAQKYGEVFELVSNGSHS